MHGKRSFSSSISRNTPSGSGKQATTYRAAAALESVLRTFADPIALKVRSGLRAGGIMVQNRSCRPLVAA